MYISDFLLWKLNPYTPIMQLQKLTKLSKLQICFWNIGTKSGDHVIYYPD